MAGENKLSDKVLKGEQGKPRLGVEFNLVAQLLGYALPSVAGIYNRSKFMGKKLDALELWTTYLYIISGAESKVTILKQKAG